MKVQFLIILLFSVLNYGSQEVLEPVNLVPVRKLSTNWQQRCDYERRLHVNVTPAPQPYNLNFTKLADPSDGPFLVLRYQFCQGYAGIDQDEQNEMNMIKYLYTAEILNVIPVHMLDYSELHCSQDDEIVQDPYVLARYERLEQLRTGQVVERSKSAKLLKSRRSDL